MKKWKKIAFALTVCLMTASMMTLTGAAYESYEPDTQTKTELLTFLEDFDKTNADSGVTFFGEANASAASFDLDACYEIYALELQADFSGERFEEMIADAVNYEVPYASSATTGVATVYRNDSGQLEFLQRTIDQNTDTMLYRASALSNIETTIADTFGSDNIMEIRLTNDTFYHIHAVYIDTTEGEYVMPFLNALYDEEKCGIRSGSIYSASDFMEWIRRAVVIQSPYDEDGNFLYGNPVSCTGGFTITPVTSMQAAELPIAAASANHSWFYPTVSGAALFIAGGIALLTFKKKKTEADASST